MGRRKNILLFVAMIENEFSHSICEGALLATRELDANLYIVPAGIVDAVYDDKDANCYRYQFNTLYSYAHNKNVDAVVLEYGSITSHMSHKRTLEFLKQFGDVPVILLAGQEEGYSSICVDNRAGLEEAIEHLIIQQNCKKIGFVSGPVDTSQDARERLEVFKQTMQKNGLSADEDWIAYGNFSEFTEELVEKFIKKHSDVEALVFANDQMAIGGYKAMNKLGLEPGKDILVTGFDDSPAAKLLEPNLTTVKVDIRELAYKAVLACSDIMEGKTIQQLVKSKLVTRQSSAASGTEMFIKSENKVSNYMDDKAIKRYAVDVFSKYFDVYFENAETVRMKSLIEQYFRYYIRLVKEDGVLQLDEGEFVEQYMEFSSIYINGYVDLYQFYSIIQYLYDYLIGLIKAEEDRLLLFRTMNVANHLLMSSVTRQQMMSNEQYKNFEIILACVTRDMLQFANDDKKRYETVITKLQKMKFRSAYVYSYGRGITHRQEDTWEMPEWLYVKAYHHGSDVHLYKGKEKRVKAHSLFDSRFLPKDRCCAMLVTPLFSGEEQYGLLLTEAVIENLHYASQIASQVSVAIEVMEIVKKQNAIKKELERNLAETVASNHKLDEISRSDYLTGIYNRRGYLDIVNRIVGDKRNYGKKAIVVYADMNNLKIVNDEFGHDEGDYSLKLIAQALSESFRQSDVVARMGGDEFAAFAMVNQDNYPDAIKERIHSTLDGMNVDNGKVYQVSMSVGTCEFVIDENVDINRILNEADMDLYIEKKAKKKQIYK